MLRAGVSPEQKLSKRMIMIILAYEETRKNTDRIDCTTGKAGICRCFLRAVLDANTDRRSVLTDRGPLSSSVHDATQNSVSPSGKRTLGMCVFPVSVTDPAHLSETTAAFFRASG